MTRAADEAELFGTLFVLGQHLTRHTDEALTGYGVTSRQWLLLAVLVRGFPGEHPTLTRAAEVVGTSRQNVKQIALQLQRRGLVDLVPDPADRRATRLRTTPRVAELFDSPAAVAQQQGLVARVFAGLDDADLARLADLVGRCLAALADGRTPA
ncbi:MarR family winged helix-turn-helix transcriptional regulator [Cellulomonas olei]|uniref:MarR family winged helix-turn-helix transcriptional regulator n=1 Tax=Cellulomonas sp. P4 TaxID=3142533 RepID=UPI0031BA5E12